MLLKDLLKGVNVKEKIGSVDINIEDVQTVSNQVIAGSLFVCIKGEKVDSHNFIKEVEKYGAVAVITERKLQTKLVQIVVDDSRCALSVIAGNFYGNAYRDMKVIGITGTNGKTTTSHLIKRIFDSANIKCGVIGTIGVYYNDEFFEANLTTPDPLELHKHFFNMREKGVKVVVMEVSAHALYLKKIEGMRFEVGIFTNLTQDHLDFFNDMETYKSAKMLMFKNNRCKYIVSNADDETGREICLKYDNVISYGIDNPSDNFALNIENKDGKNTFIINLFDKIFEIKSNLLGKFNVYNILASCTCSALLGVDLGKTIDTINSVGQVDGRIEKVFDKSFKVYIDYAHTPDGLKNVLKTLKEGCHGKLICVFGCGGNRDRLKRSIMGRISGENADFTVITSDNPRFEEPIEIMEEIEKGIRLVSKEYALIEERENGIKFAIDMAKNGDVILIAGKGAEKYQDILGVKHEYNDKISVNNILRERNLL